VRDRAEAERLDGKRCEVIQADLAKTKLPELFEACSGCSQVIHLAALLGGAKKELTEVNYEATKRLASAATRARVKKFIFCSSTSVFGNPRGSVTEDSPKRPVNNYGRSKLLAEEAVRASGVPWVVIRPSVIYGPSFLTGFGNVLGMVHRGVVPIIGDGSNRVALVHVDDAVDAFVLAASKKGVVNEDFNISGPPVTQAQCINAVEKALGAKPTRLQIPKKAAYVAAGALKLLSIAKGSRTDWPEFMRVLGEDRVFPTKKAERLLGWRPMVSFEQAAPSLTRTLSERMR
jgi:nucleoside-diphosphate-sugar epimerase